ncbi:bifunctional phosphopantothenoylcysteine decarboxylase/phosphopantothenate--cysteine ligase CoaBC [Hippea maritima]|uniref:Coenzyme A biosynthesis bifunctional protein CoaBC n=1 Tax=Hippea maritima (strain ATCC 700847 / DSM 10411 / MH2) TaxID=760142 RepID=F2LTS2_HIPMA|nr:bifunctional phosphopantothenoylcysteine decarboxylase/phosphopantothenate--cysteine ligase CoaBC [Hippea maritima]AEA34448.1 phosphopantothenoylcysteine decarboxylase/phosphopantothenate/cysteine ligase [Hippea maritima DSM 10411]
MTKANVVLGVSASIAIYKALEVLSILKKRGFNVRVALTKEASKLISPVVFKALTNKDVYIDVMEELDFEGTNITHVALAKWADIFAVVPATANVIAKLANGIADDPVSLIGLATSASKVIAPAMNSSMYLNPITQRNLNILKENGFLIVEPIEGDLACNTRGVGHIALCEDIVDVIESTLYFKHFEDKTVIVTAGPTSEPIDPVRYITNRSSGKMGFAIAKIAHFMGADVRLITGNTCLKTPYGVKRIDIETAEDMLKALKHELSKSKNEVILIMAAAIADFRPSETKDKKIKKKNENGFTLKLKQNPDLTIEIKRFAEKADIPLRIVGFAAETDNLIENAKKKIEKKGLEFIVANDVSRKDIAFGSDKNEVAIIYSNGRIERLEKASKDKIAYEILRRLI